MIEINHIREYPDLVINRLKTKNFDASQLVPLILEKDEMNRRLKKESDEVLAESNKLAKEIGNLFQQGKQEEAGKKRERSAVLKARSKELLLEMESVKKELDDLIVQLPNPPHESVPAGFTPEDNPVIKEHGGVPEPAVDALPHWELARKYNIIDFDLGSKVTGAGFPFYIGKGAKLQRALINFFLDRAQDAGYRELQPPLFVNSDSAYGTGQLPDKDGQMYRIELDDLYLIPTAEVPVTNVYRDVILPLKDLPAKNAAYSSCFRREAGSYGKDVRGLNRLHQFDKVEIVQVTEPSKSYDALEEMKDYVGKLLTQLEVPYRIILLCGGDLSFTSAKTYDFEVWSAAQKRWLEVSSVSNFVTFQSYRLKLRYRDEEGKTHLAHTLNGSALALPRLVAALLENNQTPGGIVIPEVLRKYTGFDLIS